MPNLSAKVRHAAEQATLQFNWLPEKPMLRIAEIAAATGMGTTYLEEYFSEKCHRFPSTAGARPAMRVPRTFALALLTESARYSAEEKRDAIAQAFRGFDVDELLALRVELEAELRRKMSA